MAGLAHATKAWECMRATFAPDLTRLPVYLSIAAGLFPVPRVPEVFNPGKMKPYTRVDVVRLEQTRGSG